MVDDDPMHRDFKVLPGNMGSSAPDYKTMPVPVHRTMTHVQGTDSAKHSNWMYNCKWLQQASKQSTSYIVVIRHDHAPRIHRQTDFSCRVLYATLFMPCWLSGSNAVVDDDEHASVGVLAATKIDCDLNQRVSQMWRSSRNA